MTDPAVSLRELMEARLMALALAVEKQEAAYDARFASVNEWRATFGDVAARGVTREVFDARMSDIERRLGEIERRQASQEGRALGYSAGVMLVMLIITIVIQFAGP